MYIQYLFIYLKDAETEGEGESSHPLIHSPSGHNGPDWAKSRPGAKSFIQVFLIHGRGPSPLSIFCCLPRPLEENWIGSRAARTRTNIRMDAHCSMTLAHTFYVTYLQSGGGLPDVWNKPLVWWARVVRVADLLPQWNLAFSEEPKRKLSLSISVSIQRNKLQIWRLFLGKTFPIWSFFGFSKLGLAKIITMLVHKKLEDTNMKI